MEKQTHILIIEDEQKIARLLSSYLQKDGFLTHCLYSGSGAVNIIRQDHPDLILLDLMLPGKDGISICRDVRKFSNVPIIMITAKTEEIDRLIGLELGADDYICKPFSPREVVARVRAVLRRTHPESPSNRLQVGDILLETETRTVTVAGNSLNLTPTEYGLLLVLMSSPNRVFSRSELVDRIQGYSFEGYDRTIDSHVKNLRKKLSRFAANTDSITTIYGVGYKLNHSGDPPA